jgi:histidinol dehydrogenase
MPMRLDSSAADFEARFKAFLATKREVSADVDAAVAAIIARVRAEGDRALVALSGQFDGIDLARTGIAVTKAEVDRAVASIDKETRGALELARERIARHHERQRPADDSYTDAVGARLGSRWTAVESVGLYVPGGLASYPSSVLMNALPAKVAGVPRIVMVVPAPRGELNPLVLAAAHLSGVCEIYRIGGAQAVAALAYGTETIAPVVKIVGPGNAFVAAAKRQVFGHVGIDSIAGPSEVLIIADRDNDPEWLAADLLAQAEHDVLATAILLTPSAALAGAVQAEVACQMESLSRDDIIALSIANQGGIVLTRDIEEAVELADAYAPEHLCLATAEPRALAEGVHNAGGLFFGERSFEVLGDYVAGPSHTMPTGGTARFASPLSVIDFVRITSIIDLDDRTATELSAHAARLARAEALTAHAAAADFRAGAEAKS